MPGRLYDLGRYPGMLEPRDPEDWVEGDMYYLGGDPDLLADLDAYENGESPQPAFFDRQMASAILSDGATVAAWVYWFRGAVDEGKRIVSGRFI